MFEIELEAVLDTASQPDTDIELLLPEELELDISVTVPGGGGYYPEYSGSYSVVPRALPQTLQTQNTVLKDNLVIQGIPYSEVSNAAKGTTVSIG